MGVRQGSISQDLRKLFVILADLVIIKCRLPFQSFFPGLIQCVYVLRPAGFFQKAISEVSSKFFKDEFRFKTIVCAQMEELHVFIHPSQLTSDIGGSLFYSHHEWIQQRIVSIEVVC